MTARATTGRVAATALAALASGASGCGTRPSTDAAPPATARSSVAAPAPAPTPPAEHGRSGLREVVFRGACDASGAVPLSERHFVVADDEDNILRVYDADAGGAPLRATDLSPALGLPLKGKKHPKAPEADVEAATRVGDRAYWLTSHGRSSQGKLKEERLNLFATTLLGVDGEIRLVGHPYDRLMQDVIAAPELQRFDLAEAATRAPKAEGGFNIEGLTASPDGRVIMAFRNPIPEGKALVVPILDIASLVDSPASGPARLGPPTLLDLDGRGVRSLSWWHGRFLLIGGHHAEGGTSRLYGWSGPGERAVASAIDLAGYNPEAFFTPEERDEILIVSDDGSRPIDGVPCKELADPARKQFRGVWLVPDLPSP
jgi:hypothetical protein